MTIFSILMFIFWLFILSCPWLLYCNHKTFDTRIKIINSYRNYPKAVDSFNEVEYNTHMWRLVFFRDPMKLYHEDVVKALESYEET